MLSFLIITPSFNQIKYLHSCVSSVFDQLEAEVSVLHHIQDGGSKDETVEVFDKISKNRTLNKTRKKSGEYSLNFFSKPDEGMYDAINKSISLVSKHINDEHDIIMSWINCDEQFLPGTLGKVSTFFQEHPETDILFGGMLVVDENGELLSCRKAMPMRKTYLEASYLYNYSCAMFFRRSLWEKLGGFDTAYKNAGDEDLIRRALSAGARTAVLDEYLSTFTYRTDNLSSDPKAADEHARLKGEDGLFVRSLKPLINLMRLAEKWMRGGHRQTGPIEYDIYFNGSEKRQHFVCENPTTRWPDHAYPYLLRHRLNR